MTTAPPTRIIVAEDHPVYRDGVCRILEGVPSFTIVHIAGDGRAALEKSRELSPDILILDIDLPGMGGIEVAEALQADRRSQTIIFLTMYDDADMVNHAMDVGALGYVLKDSAADEIRAAVESVAAGMPYVTPSLAQILINRRSGAQNLRRDYPGLEDLTDSERRVLKLVASDRTSKEIAEVLGLSPRTIENHRAKISQKLGLSGAHSLVKFAFEHRSKM
ncbi:MAG: response regulator [Verrucomicrobiales bacterium]